MVNQDRVPPFELRGYEEALCEWQSPSAFVELTNKVISNLRSVQFFNDGRLRFARDAWVGARLASVTKADEVRLCPDRWPDYEERSVGQMAQYEITEADLPGRRRGDEYKQAESNGFKPESDPVENWVARAELAPQALQIAAQRKADKGYPTTARLVIYLNIDEFGIRRSEIEDAMSDRTAPARAAFREVWVLWQRRLYCLWKDGKTSGLIVQVPEIEKP